jgi:hypothetical protein
MKRIYLSSTIADLKKFRRAVSDTLRSCGYDVDSMERYAARDNRPKAACEADVANSDYYVGIFAWRYGYVPKNDNPDGRSITELEYLAAAMIPRFIFLLDDRAPWPSAHRDRQTGRRPTRIRKLRNSVKDDRWVGYFDSPDSLAKSVLVSLLQHEATKQSESLKLLSDIQSAGALGTSYLQNIGAQMDALGSVEFVSLCLGPTPWWNTRLHLVAALASDFTDIQQFLVFNATGAFELVAPPVEIRRALAKAYPKLEAAYHMSRELPTAHPSAIDSVLENYSAATFNVFGKQESEFKQVVTPVMLREFGIRQRGEVIERSGRSSDLLLRSDIVRRPAQFLILMRDGKFEGIVDRVQVASRLAQAALG